MATLKRLLKGVTTDINDIGGFKYDFPSFESAESYLFERGSDGYSSDDFLAKLHKSAGLVRDGMAAYERDSYIFDQVLYSWPLLSSLLLAAGQKDHLNVVDFGGGLGSSFRQNEKFLSLVTSSIDWTVVEQHSVVAIGKKFFEKNNLKFISSISQLNDRQIDLCLFSGSLCYLSDPHQKINQIVLLKPKYIVIDRTPLIEGELDSFGVQYVPASIFKASYPIIFLSRIKLFNLLSENYTMIEKWISDDQPDTKSSSEGSLWMIK
jgi:putative methyltransferase (TIGR04325 family)